MGEFRDHISAKRSEVPERQLPGSSEVPAKAGVGGFLKNVSDGFSGRARAVLTAAILAAASPAVGSCANVVEVDERAGDVSGVQVANGSENSANDWQSRYVLVSCTKDQWGITGNWAGGDFGMNVYVDGKVVDSQDVPVDLSKNGMQEMQFAESGLTGGNAKNVHFQTFAKDGTEIPFKDDPQGKGMFGTPDCPASAY